jgi:pimeloyl-ACP methyl ester carboxylesterase
MSPLPRPSDVPETRYAPSNGVQIAYQVVGDGPIDIVHVSNWTWAVDLVWDWQPLVDWMSKLGTIGRVIHFDMPGTGSSDPLPGDRPTTLEEWMDTVAALLDAENVERAALLAQDIGGMMAMLFAAAHPERTSSLTIVGSTARMGEAPDYPIGFPQELNATGVAWWVNNWGRGTQIKLTAPSLAYDEDSMALQGRYERLTLSPATTRQLFSLIADLDVRAALSAIRVPTLVIHRRGDRWLPVSHGRYLADHISGARYVELPGDDHFPFTGDTDSIVEEIREFLGVVRKEKPPENDRLLATVLFTDIVSSTERAAELGDRRWKELLDSHDRMVRVALDQFRGREVKTTGDGFLATFDGPGKAISCATSIREGALRLGIEVRAGLHVGEIEMRGDDIGGLAVHAASRVMSNAAPSEILVSSTVKDLVIGAGIEFDDRGARELKGVPGTWNLFAVAS